MKKPYNKLIRDRIPSIIEQAGKQCVIETLNNDDYFDRLNEKLAEELEEYNHGFSLEELADLLEVVYAILDYKKVSRDEFEKIRQAKLAERGGFTQPKLRKIIACLAARHQSTHIFFSVSQLPRYNVDAALYVQSAR